MLSTDTDSNYLLQNINAENILETKKYEIKNQTTISINKNNHSTYNYISIGAWVPLNNSLILQQLKGEVQKNAIKTLLNQGFHEYYFAMNNFEDTESTKLTEELLKSAEDTNLKIIIILRPPSEGNSDTNYDWKGWIKYLLLLKRNIQNHLKDLQ